MIKDKRYFTEIIKTGKYKKNNLFVLYHKKHDENKYPHFGIAIKNSIGKAHVRNKLKRQTRNIIDKYKIEFKKDEDYIIMIRNECKDASYREMDNQLFKLLKGINDEKK